MPNLNQLWGSIIEIKTKRHSTKYLAYTFLKSWDHKNQIEQRKKDQKPLNRKQENNRENQWIWELGLHKNQWNL